MGHVAGLEAQALGQITAVALVLGAGLPALFALGIRASAWGADGRAGPSGGAGTRSHPAGRALSILIFAVVVLVALLGITLIVATGYGKAISFEHVYPTIVDK